MLAIRSSFQDFSEKESIFLSYERGNECRGEQSEPGGMEFWVERGDKTGIGRCSVRPEWERRPVHAE